MTDESILITGANGLIGRHLLNRLVREGRRAIGIDLAARDAPDRVLVCDITDIHRLYSLARQYSLTDIIHCGAISGPMVMLDNPYGIIRANVDGTANIMEMARVMGLRRLVFCSSTSAYGPTDDTGAGITERAPLRPGSVYGASKVACEQLLAAYRRQHGQDNVAIRLSWVYGPGRTTDCVIRSLITAVLRRQAVEWPWGADFHRQYIYVDDAASALLAALDAPRCPDGVYTATGGSYLTLAEVAETVQQVLGQGQIRFADGPDPLDDVQHRFDISAIADGLGFVPHYSLSQGIRAYADWLAPLISQEIHP
ncbi:NAD-dependent epimerase/dehydratase family protein [Sodalis sp. RH15]|uniref:NAD-dependent epimerase/dehydratase family protein n=1 Tax=Sodalis sp. RH15 TaxID=3394330 RepID=UPI0039B41E04